MMTLDDAGILRGARFIASPHCDARPADAAIELIVVHNISLPPETFGGAGIIQLFTGALNPDAHPYYRQIAGLRVSAHFLIRRDGEIIQFVPCAQRAWHAGISRWRGRERCNDFSIGIELEGSDTQPFADAQYAQFNVLARALTRKYPIVDIAGHAEIAPGRKTDPGPFFDWSRVSPVARGDRAARVN